MLQNFAGVLALGVEALHFAGVFQSAVHLG